MLKSYNIWNSACFRVKMILLILGWVCFSASNSYSQSLPFLKKGELKTQLIVDGKPFLMLAGELSNSVSGSLKHMEGGDNPLPRKTYRMLGNSLGTDSNLDMEYKGSVWQQMVDLNVNTVLAAVSWEMIEPEEGKFDFSVVDAMIKGAREKGLRLIPLWFGTWKNGMSSYVPLWVKKDYKRFPRVKTEHEGSVEIISAFSKEALHADAKAFAALMKHIKEIDSEHQTVIMVQVENEVGILGDSRDRSEVANKAFKSEVPKELMDYLTSNKKTLVKELDELWKSSNYKKSGSWSEVFGTGVWTDLVFMAWQYSIYMNEVTKQGKSEYNLPMFVNAWLEYTGMMSLPGGFPSGGPLPRVFDIWKAGAPDVDFMSPDIYGGDFVKWCDQYTMQGNPLLIPETWWNKEEYVQKLMFAIGNYNTLGVAPFGIDRVNPLETQPIRDMYQAMEYLSTDILKYQGNKNRMTGFLLSKEQPQVEFEMENYFVKAELYARRGEIKVEDAFGIIINTDEDQFTISGGRALISFRPIKDSKAKAGIGPVDEYIFHDGNWIRGRRLGGDETNRGRHVFLPVEGIGIQKAIIYQYK
ncbi:MAG: DUF5597 domain-containing protein [Reichenbachiella sp.]